MIFERNDGKQINMPDIDEPDFARAVQQVSPYCMWAVMNGIEVLYGLWNNIRYVVRHRIPGDFVECGVWRGGMTMLAAMAFRYFGDTSRTLWLYDTFDGHPEPHGIDCQLEQGGVKRTWENWHSKGLKWGYGGTLEDVRKNISQVDYPQDQFIFIEGMVEDTIPDTIPDRISILRLDTDFYYSTRHEFEYLYPRLSVGGVLIVDDYGSYEGSRKATDEYMEENNLKLMLSRFSTGPREAIKLEA